MPNLKQNIRELQEHNLFVMSLLRDEAVHLFEVAEDRESKIVATLSHLFSYIFSRSQTISFLIGGGYDWDAEIILRSFYETAAKIIYICSVDDEERPTLVNEFWDELGPISDRKNAVRASYAEEALGEGVSSKILRALQNGKIFDLESEGNKHSRKRLEKKWSFTEIISVLEARSLKGKPLKGIKSLLHMYGSSSHLIHADKFAMDLMHDRATRPAEELIFLKAGHVSRIMSDQVNILWLCIENFLDLTKGHFKDEMKLKIAYQKFSTSSNLLITLFEENQSPFYHES
ncbi:hypothetical protein FV222_22040 [Methylobacterium sp. WL103]|uniref:DUF5677 domain-containing protein n=1 Tax=Methylobacterium sp. WL103 TaxID=2603891 RepID=UPI0011C80AAE|nr:DUF5677 domain-containing protein [Methylobacterium sp. WL103]TXM93737.1 hypothetical protein FV222_22040 [Methylobacterium sp. WL103]